MGGDILAGHRQPTPLDWRAAKAPSLAEFEAIAAEAFDALPDAFKQHCQGVAILIRDYPERDQLAAVGLKNELDLLGLYEGVDLTQASGFDAPQDLTRIYLFRRPLLDYWAEHDETLGGLITHVLVHEIGHHFGLSDAQMQAIEDAAG
ncbi:MAG: metallopeptidase family protein [Pseudomonadota bacterium]